MANFETILDLLKTHKNDLPIHDATERDNYVNEITNEINKLIQRDKDDLRLATQIAVDTSKMFIKIAIAVFVAIGGFIQFAYKNSPGSLPLMCLYAAGALTFFSMVSGFVVISRAYKRGDGRIKPKELPWYTKDLSGPINVQAWLGVLAMLAFAIAIIGYNTEQLRSPKTLTPKLSDFC
jgi:hypothetical protein